MNGSQGNGQRLFPLFTRKASTTGAGAEGRGTSILRTSSASSLQLSPPASKSLADQDVASEVLSGDGVVNGVQLASSSRPCSPRATSLRSASLQPAAPPLVRMPTPPAVPVEREVIHISDSPVRESGKTKTFEDLAEERRARKAQKAARGWYGGQQPPWPTRDSMHVKAIDLTSELKPLAGTPLHKRISFTPGTAAVQLAEYNGRPPPFLQAGPHEVPVMAAHGDAEQTSSTPSASCRFPIFDRLATEVASSGSNQLAWTASYAPTRVTEIVGERSAQSGEVLKEWMLQLSLSNLDNMQMRSPKRKVKREVDLRERKRRRKDAKRNKRIGRRQNGYSDDDEQSLDDFIASDTEEFDHIEDTSSPPPFDAGTERELGWGGHAIQRFKPLTNLILLCGPVGSGKTCSVYAVAQELGWQVFELFPGMGKRGSKEFEHYVGMVGQNHLLLRKERGIEGKASSGKSHITVDDPPAHKEERKVSQSLVLIEEVDLLYASDAGFWEALIAFVAKSRRPVILTCNDPFTIPFTQLPLQTTLSFEKPSWRESSAFLQQVLQHQGVEETAADYLLHRLWEGRTGGAVDLRQALTQLQYASRCPVPAQSPPNGVNTFFPATFDDISYADAELDRRSATLIADDETVRYQADDVEVGYLENVFHYIEHPPYQSIERGFPIFAWGIEAAALVTRHSSDHPEALAEIRRKHANTATSLVHEAIYSGDSDLGSSRLFAEYLPTLRNIVLADDEQERAYNEAIGLSEADELVDSRVRRSRRLAGPYKEKYRRWNGLEGELAESIRAQQLSL